MFKDSLKSKPFGIIATAVILFSALSLAACGGGGGSESSGVSSTSGCVSGGSGTSASPYIICTAADLKTLAEEVNLGTEPVGRYYLLGDNIDLSAYSTGTGWTPIGNNTNRFRGNFDGDGKTVSNLYINDSALLYAGLFGYISNGYVKNTGINNANITARTYVGGVAGIVLTADITYCYVTGKISSGNNNYVGGIAGQVTTNSSIANSYATSEVSGYQRVGGIAGQVATNSSIANSYATGKVSGDSYVGGIAGWINNSSITNSYATGEVSGSTEAAGGIVGLFYGNGDILRSYATGKVSGFEYVGGIAGELLTDSITDIIKIADSYATGQVSGDSGVGGIAGHVSNNSLITSSYATGEVSGDLRVGGIVGEIGFSGNPVTRCAALNPRIVRINGSYLSFGRLAGNIPPAVSNSVAWTGMGMPSEAFGVLTGAQGTDYGSQLISTANAKNKDTYTSPPLNWGFGLSETTPWKWGGDINAGYPLPVLYWQTDAQILSLPTPMHLAP